MNKLLMINNTMLTVLCMAMLLTLSCATLHNGSCTIVTRRIFGIYEEIGDYAVLISCMLVGIISVIKSIK